MDRLEAMIAVAHRRLQLRRMLMAIEKNPQILEVYMPLDIKRPMELAGLKSRLTRAKMTERAIEDTGRRYDAVLDRIDELHGAARGHAGALELQESELRSVVEGMIGGSNGGPNDGQESSTESSEDGSQVVTSRAVDQQ